MKPTVSIYTLGCRVNQYESSVIAATLEENGFSVVPFGEMCDVAVVNSCTVTAESDRKSRQLLRRAAKYARIGVVATGCFAEISSEAASGTEGVIAVLGNRGKGNVADAVMRAVGMIPDAPEKRADIFGECKEKLTRPERVRTFIKIEDGCESKCAYCIIPKARGPVRSKAPALILEEARALTEAGSPEIILTGIEISAYGRDLPDRKSYDLSHLIADISKIPSLRRLGLGSLDPSVMTEAFLTNISACDALVRHFHLSLQSGSSSVLRRMRRRYSAEQALEYIARIRRYFPDSNISADIIVGFPDESEAEFAETVRFCERADFLNLHIFPYSPRKGTEAAEMSGQLPDAVKRERASRLESLHARSKAVLMARYAERGTPVHVLFEQCRNGILTGHSEHYVELAVKGSPELVGRICPVIPHADGTGELL